MKLSLPEAEVTSSLSNNMIKAYQIGYDKEKGRKLDMSAREQSILERIHELLPEQRFLVQQPGTEEDSFVPGIVAESISEITEEQQPAFTEADMEAMRASVREELTAEIQQQANELMANAQVQADQLLARAKEDAETAKASILKLASAQGYEEGLKRAKEEQAQKVSELEAEKLQLQQEYERRVSELEPAFVTILTELVKKLTGISYENHKEVLTYLIDAGIHSAEKDASFTVWMNTDDLNRISDLLPELCSKYEGKLSLDFKGDEGLEKGSCRLENAGRLIDCSLGTRMQGLLDALDMLDVSTE
ncbi:MAG: FliH/SctL family protein [Lachnospiraceae bacterium]